MRFKITITYPDGRSLNEPVDLIHLRSFMVSILGQPTMTTGMAVSFQRIA